MLKRVGCTRNSRPVSEWLSDWQGKAMIRLQSNKSNASNNHYIYILLSVYLLCWRRALNFWAKDPFFIIFYWIVSNIKINHGCCQCAHSTPPDYFSWLGILQLDTWSVGVIILLALVHSSPPPWPSELSQQQERLGPAVPGGFPRGGVQLFVWPTVLLWRKVLHW